MRIISQNGKSDIPYEHFAFSIVGNGSGYSIIATRNIAEPPEVAINSVIATYLTKEKAIKAMKMLEKHHRLDLATNLISERVKKFFANARRIESNAEIMADISEALTKYEYFRFPQDDEIEV